MKYFAELPADDDQLRRRVPVAKMGVNDAPYLVSFVVEGKMAICPYYQKWKTMIETVYSYKKRRSDPIKVLPTSVCAQWRDSFMVFRCWVEKQEKYAQIEDMELSKVFYDHECKVYSPETCCFVPKAVLHMMKPDKIGAVRMRGVVYYQKLDKYAAKVTIDHKLVHLGMFDTEALAHETYINARNKILLEFMDGNTDKIQQTVTQFLNGDSC